MKWQEIVGILIGFSIVFGEMWFLELAQRRLRERRHSKALMALAGPFALAVPSIVLSLAAVAASPSPLSAARVVGIGCLIAFSHALMIVSGGAGTMPGMRKDYENLDGTIKVGIRSVFPIAIGVGIVVVAISNW
ncbi:hypothetical protein JW848_02620 [Candidatus Bipolaricaulota bacterium]|nr:hypothetical protein [Candidatus Bipolaricaulota bacterium]